MWYVGVVQAQQAALFKKWSIYTSDFFGAQKMNSKLPQVIFYREADFIEREVADIYIDGKYWRTAINLYSFAHKHTYLV